MRKNFILDTNVLLHDPRSIYSFKDNNVIIPIYVIEEIDQFKRDLSELGRNARLVARYLDSFRDGGLAQGGRAAAAVAGMLRVCFTDRELPLSMADSNLMDNRILAVAIDLMEQRAADRRPSSSPRTPTCASARTRWASSPRTTTPSGWRSPSSTPASPSCLVPRELVDQMYKPGAEVEVSGQDTLSPQPVHPAQGRDQPVAHRDGPLQRGQGPGRAAAARHEARASGASARATWSRASRSTCCSTTRSSSSPSWARRARARRCSRSPRGSTR